MRPIVVRDSVTRLEAADAGCVAVCGSHAGIYAAYRAARAAAAAVVLNDAGVGRDCAGVLGLAWLEALGIPACSVDFESARIGDGTDTMESGIVSFTNAMANTMGVQSGMSCQDAARRLQAAQPRAPALKDQGIMRERVATSGHRPVWTMDSITLLEPGDKRAIAVSGSHGAVLGAKSQDDVVKTDIFAAFFNDAGGGKDGAGFSRLAALESRSIAAATVSAHSARIGDGRSTYDTGVLSRINGVATRLGWSKACRCAKPWRA